MKCLLRNVLLKIAQKALTAPSWNFPVLSMPNKGWFGLTVVSATAGCIVFKLGGTSNYVPPIDFLQNSKKISPGHYEVSEGLSGSNVHRSPKLSQLRKVSEVAEIQ